MKKLQEVKETKEIMELLEIELDTDGFLNEAEGWDLEGFDTDKWLQFINYMEGQTENKWNQDVKEKVAAMLAA